MIEKNLHLPRIFTFMALLSIASVIHGQTTLITDGTWKGVGNSSASGGMAWLFPGYDDSAWPTVEAPNAANVIPVVPGSLSIWVLPYSDTAKMRKTFTVPVGDAYSGSISINADNEFELYFNGVSQGFFNNWMAGPFVFNISPGLQGCVQNVIAINAANWGGPYGASLSTTLNVTNPLNTPVANEEINTTCTSFTANWDSVATADFYLLDVSTDPLFGSFYSVYHDFNVGSSLAQTLSSLPPGITYYYRLRCQRGSLLSCYSNVIAVDLNDPNITLSAPDSLCAGSPITLQLTAPGANISWTGPAGFTSTDSVANITNTSALNTGSYVYTVNYPGCPAITDTIHIEVVDNPDLTITPSGPYCSTVTVDTLISNGGTVTWAGAGITNVNTGTFNPSLAGGGNHTITCISSGYCPDTATTMVTVSVDGGYTISGSDTLCEGENIVLNSTTGSGATVNWTGPNSYSSNSNNNTIPGAQAIDGGDYVLTVSYTACPTAMDTIHVTVLNYPDISITPAGPFCNDAPSQNLVATPAGGIWSGTGITNSLTGTFDPAIAGTGTHLVYYTMPGHCASTDTALINVMNAVSLASVIFPNVFTPNGDGLNDLYAPIVPTGGHYKLSIYDRWGVEILIADTDASWNGSIGSSIANDGVYFWICEITSDCSSEPLVQKGFVQLFKQ